jgi:hypothetical protein
MSSRKKSAQTSTRRRRSRAGGASYYFPSPPPDTRRERMRREDLKMNEAWARANPELAQDCRDACSVQAVDRTYLLTFSIDDWGTPQGYQVAPLCVFTVFIFLL